MSTTTKHGPLNGSPTTLLSTALNSLADSTNSSSSSTYDNSTSLYLVADVELVVTYGTAPTAGNTVELYICDSIDGTNFADASQSSAELWCVFPLQNTTSAQRIVRRDLPLPPGKCQFFARNRAGQTMASSGNTVRIAEHSIQSA